MKNPKSLKFSPSSDEFEKILNNLRTLVEEKNIEVRKLNKKILPLKDELDSVLFKLKKLNSLNRYLSTSRQTPVVNPSE